MTNGEKYLKNEEFLFDISKGIAEAICYDDMEHSKEITEKEIRNWFTSNIKPTLTEDERVILRNIKNVRSIRRDNEGDLIVYKIDTGAYYITMYNHLFKFIKERRRI